MTTDDIDWVAVDRAVHGDHRVTLNRPEMGEAWRVLESRGLSSRRIAAILGVTDRTVCRWRANGYPSMHYQRGRWLRQDVA